MRRTVITLTLALAAVFASAQDMTIRIHYAARYHSFATQEKAQEDEMALDICNGRSHFYSKYTARREAIKDSVLAVGGTIYDAMDACERAGCKRTRLSWQIWKNLPRKGELTFTDKVLQPFRYTETLETLQWELADSGSVVCGYSCQMARCSFRGRRWTVFYTTEIPVPEGPWKLGGLPGLILWAEEDEGLFSFHCNGIESLPPSVIAVQEQKYNDCTKSEYYRLMRLRLSDPLAFDEKMSGFSGKAFDALGRPMRYEPKKAVFLEAPLATSAQEKARLRVTYNSTFDYSKREKPLPCDTLILDEQVLEIGTKKAVFYSEKYKTFEEERRQFTGEVPWDFSIRWNLKQGQAYRIFRDLSQPEEITVSTDVHFIGYPYVYKDTLERIRWDVLKEDSVILGHNCRKAEADFRGRHWTVWFAKDIRQKLGPWKLGGLPGLILSAKEDEGIFSFDCTKIEEDCGEMHSFSLDGYAPCTLREYQSECTEFWHDSVYYICKKNGHENPPRGAAPRFEAIFIERLK